MFAIFQAIRRVFSTKASREAGRKEHEEKIDLSDMPEQDFSKGVRGKYTKTKRKRK
jgi:hypothetical protein